MKNYKKNEDAVSPVIGVILMVSVTVILAAIIAAFVFGMAGDLHKTKVVAVTVTATPNYIHVVNMGGQDVNALSSINVASGDATYTVTQVTAIGNTVGSVGNYTITAPLDVGKRPVVITGTFTDGTTQVILTTNV